MSALQRAAAAAVLGLGLTAAAVTATTGAFWQVGETLPPLALRSGTIGLTVAPGPEAQSGFLTPGESLRTPVTLTNAATASDGGVPLQVSVSSVSGTGDASLLQWLRLRVDSGACGASLAEAVLSAPRPEPVGPVLGPGDSAPACVVLSLPDSVDVPDLQAKSVALLVTFEGAQTP